MVCSGVGEVYSCLRGWDSLLVLRVVARNEECNLWWHGSGGEIGC